MNIAVLRQTDGTYNVVGTGGIVLGHIARDGRRWIGHDKHIGTFQGEDHERYATLNAATVGAGAYYAIRDFCSEGCGHIVIGRGACIMCDVRMHRPQSECVDDSVTGDYRDALEYGDTPEPTRYAIVDNAPGSWHTCRIVDTTTGETVGSYVSHFQAGQYLDEFNAAPDPTDRPVSETAAPEICQSCATYPDSTRNFCEVCGRAIPGNVDPIAALNARDAAAPVDVSDITVTVDEYLNGPDDMHIVGIRF